MNSLKQQFTILVADDNKDNLKVLREILKTKDFQVRFVTDGQQVIDHLEKEIVDLILLDIHMPVMNGFQTCEKLQQSEKTKYIPVIFLSAADDKETIIDGLKLGAVDYVTKPFIHEELLFRVDTQLKLVKSIEKRKNLESELKIKAIRQERSIEFLNTTKSLVNGICHEINNPLNLLYNSSLLIKDHFENEFGKRDRQEMIKLINITCGEALKANQLVARLAILSSFSNLTKEKINVFSLVESVVKNIEDETCEYDLSEIPSDISIVSSKSGLFHAVSNIVLNSIEAIKLCKSEKGKVLFECTSQNDFVILKISDNGGGVNEKNISNIFRPFFTTKIKGRAKGLGLTEVENIIVGQNLGEIFTENTTEGGFSVALHLYID